MNALAIVNIVEKVTDLLISIMEVLIVRQVDLFFLDGADDAFSIAILSSCTYVCHADSDLGIIKQVNIGGGSILPALVRVMNFGCGSS